MHFVECAPATMLAGRLRDRFHEAPIIQGVSERGLMQVWRNKDSSTHTVTVTSPQGGMCIVAAGEYLEPVEWELETAGDGT